MNPGRPSSRVPEIIASREIDDELIEFRGTDERAALCAALEVHRVVHFVLVVCHCHVK